MRTPTWRRWLLATMLGGVAGNTFLVALLGLWFGGGSAFGASALGGVVIGVAAVGIQGVGAAIGLGIGLCQWRVLKGAGADVPRAGWVGASVAGGLLPWWPVLFAVVLGSSNGGQPVTNAGAYVGGVTVAAALFGGIAGGLCGVVPGIAHGLILRRLRPRARKGAVALWIAATVLGWGASWALEGAALGLLATSRGVSGPSGPVLLAGGLLLLAGCWAVHGALTGGALIAMTGAGTAGTGEGSGAAVGAGAAPTDDGPATSQSAIEPDMPPS